MKAMTGLLVGAAVLLSGFAGAQYFPQASVSGLVLSEGPRGFMLEGPDGNYGIVVTPATIVTDPWHWTVATGAGNVHPGDYVTATGYPTDQWVMMASQVVVRNATPPSGYQSFGGYYGIVLPGAGLARTPNTYPLLQQGVTTTVRMQ